jgi:hypothetical protein
MTTKRNPAKLFTATAPSTLSSTQPTIFNYMSYKKNSEKEIKLTETNMSTVKPTPTTRINNTLIKKKTYPIQYLNHYNVI